MSTTVLVVEDDADLREAMTVVLEGTGYAVVCAETLGAARAVLRGGLCPGVVVLDLVTPDRAMSELLALMRAASCPSAMRIVVVTVAPPEHHPVGVPVLRKPFDIDELLEAVAGAGRE